MHNERRVEQGEVDLNGNQQSHSGGWANTITMTTGETDKIGSLAANFPIAGLYTVEISVELPYVPDHPTGKAPDLEALITWSVEGHSVRRRVSVGYGVSVSAPAQGIQVQLFDMTDNSGGYEAADYIASVLITPGVRPSDGQPPTLDLQGFTVLPGQDTVDINAIPAGVGAKSVLITAIRYGNANNIVVTQPAPGFIQVVQEDANGLPLKVYDPRDYGFMPLSPGCVNVLIRNYEVDLADTAVGYTVTIGIDG